MSCLIEVLSQQPPGGRCALYAGYAETLSSCLDVEIRIIYTDCRDAHGEGFPSLLLNGAALQPADGVILTPEDVYAGLARAGVRLDSAPDILDRLNAHVEKMLEG